MLRHGVERAVKTVEEDNTIDSFYKKYSEACILERNDMLSNLPLVTSTVRMMQDTAISDEDKIELLATLLQTYIDDVLDYKESRGREDDS